VFSENIGVLGINVVHGTSPLYGYIEGVALANWIKIEPAAGGKAPMTNS